MLGKTGTKHIWRGLFWTLFFSLPVLAEPPTSEEKVNEALKNFEWTLTRRANRFNERYPNWDVSYGDMDRLAMQKRDAQDQIEAYGKLARFYKEMGADAQYREATARQRDARTFLRMVQEEYNKYRKAGKEEYYPEHQKEAQVRRTEMLRHATQKMASVTSSLSEPEVLQFMEALMSWRPGNRLTGAVDLRLVFGPEYHINDLVREVRRRALDVLADWGTKEAWEVVARAATGRQGFLSVRMTALQHLMGEMTAEKAQALQSAAPGNEFLDKVTALHQRKPHTFRQGVKYLDLQNPGNAPVVFEGLSKHPEFRKKGAKNRFVPVGEINPTKLGFQEATRRVTPTNRWAKMASRFRTMTREPAPPKPKVVPPAIVGEPVSPPVAEVAPAELPVVPVTETPVAPPSGENAPVEPSQGEQKPEPKEPRRTIFGDVWGAFLERMRLTQQQRAEQPPGKPCDVYGRLGKPNGGGFPQ